MSIIFQNKTVTVEDRKGFGSGAFRVTVNGHTREVRYAAGQREHALAFVPHVANGLVRDTASKPVLSWSEQLAAQFGPHEPVKVEPVKTVRKKRA